MLLAMRAFISGAAQWGTQPSPQAGRPRPCVMVGFGSDRAAWLGSMVIAQPSAIVTAGRPGRPGTTSAQWRDMGDSVGRSARLDLAQGGAAHLSPYCGI